MLRAHRIQYFVLTLILVYMGSSSVPAQLVPDGGSAVIDGITTNGGIVYVGNDLSFTSLLVTNNATVTNAIEFIIGHHASSRSNSVVLTGADTAWVSDSATIVGNAGSFNRLEIRDGAYLTNRYVTIGLGSGSATNITIVSDTNSFLAMSGTTTIGDQADDYWGSSRGQHSHHYQWRQGCRWEHSPRQKHHRSEQYGSGH
jgi:T5SS/PEP-CTERM-associated repeat protein